MHCDRIQPVSVFARIDLVHACVPLSIIKTKTAQVNKFPLFMMTNSMLFKSMEPILAQLNIIHNIRTLSI